MQQPAFPAASAGMAHAALVAANGRAGDLRGDNAAALQGALQAQRSSQVQAHCSSCLSTSPLHP